MASPLVSLTCTFGALRGKKTFQSFTRSQSSQVTYLLQLTKLQTREHVNCCCL